MTLRIDRSGWSRGPWDLEPEDRLEWRYAPSVAGADVKISSPETARFRALWADLEAVGAVIPKRGMPCLMLRNQFGSWCGYVGLPPGHPWLIAHANAEAGSRIADVCDISVHGGITYGPEANNDLVFMIQGSETPDEDEEDERSVWIGFDCAHALDLCPAILNFGNWVYKTRDWVKAEVERLAAQAIAALKTT